MKILAAILGPRILGSTSASPIRDRDARPFNITNFSAGCVPHSFQNYYDFTVQVSPATSATTCSARTHSYTHMANLTRMLCLDTAVSFNFTRTADGGAYLIVWWKPTGHSDLRGTFVIPAAELPLRGIGTSQYELYDGPASFWITDIVVEPTGGG